MRTVNRTVWVLVAVAGLVAAGCSRAQKMDEALTAYATEEPQAAPDYVVEQPDSINIEVQDNPQFSRGAQLRPDGKITMPLLGDVSVTGLTSLEIDEQLTKLYSRYLKEVEITVTVTSFASKNVYIVREPGGASAQPYTGNQHFLKTLARAGGPGANAAARRLLLVRASAEKPEIYKIDFQKIVRRGLLDEEHNPTIRDGDIIYIPMDVFSWIGFHISKLMVPVNALFQPIRAVDTWTDVFGG